MPEPHAPGRKGRSEGGDHRENEFGASFGSLLILASATPARKRRNYFPSTVHRILLILLILSKNSFLLFFLCSACGFDLAALTSADSFKHPWPNW